MEYSTMPMDFQIKVNHLIQNYHHGKYPLSWYETLPLNQITSMHDDYLKIVSKNIKKLFTQD